MNPYKIKQKAIEMGVSQSSALKMRMRYLVEQILVGHEWIYGDINSPMPYVMQDEAVQELQALLKSLKTLNDAPRENAITQDMIEQAKAVPIDSLIEFIRGKARCFAHDDKSPSMYYATKKNAANCPVCNKSWDSIEILKERDGLTFTKAVKELCSLC
jgi:hypothetical protein